MYDFYIANLSMSPKKDYNNNLSRCFATVCLLLLVQFFRFAAQYDDTSFQSVLQFIVKLGVEFCLSP